MRSRMSRCPKKNGPNVTSKNTEWIRRHEVGAQKALPTVKSPRCSSAARGTAASRAPEIAEPIDNGLLEFDLRTTSRAYGAPVWNGDVAVDVYSLSRNGNKITGANASLGRDEQSPRSRLKKCHADNVSDAKTNILRSAAILKFAG